MTEQQTDVPVIQDVPQLADSPERNGDRFIRIQRQVNNHEPLSHADQTWIMDMLKEYAGALSWETSCLNCARVLDSSVEEMFRRETVEQELHEAGLANQAMQTHIASLEAEVATLRAAQAWTRTPKPFYETDFAVRGPAGRLVAYHGGQNAPVPGDVVIVGDKGSAVLARVHAAREVPPRPLQHDPLWALDLDWTFHW